MAYQLISYTDLAARMRERVGDNSTFWSDDEFRDAINEAISVWQAGTGEWNVQIPFKLNTIDTFYDVPRQIVSVTRVGSFGTASAVSTATWLPVISLSDLDYGFPGWPATTGTPEFWCPVGLNKFAIYPRPTSEVSIILDGFSGAPELINEQYIDIGSEEVLRLLDYAQWYLSFKEGVSEGVESTDPLLTSFYNAVMLRNTRLQAVAEFRRYLGEDFAEWQRIAKQPQGRGLGVRKGLQSGA